MVFSFERMKKNTPSFMRHARLVDKLEAVDKYTVRFTWQRPDVTFFDGFQLFLGSKAYFDRVGDKEFMNKPSGLGPYRVAEYKPGQYIDVAAFDGYYGDKPKLQAARFYIVKDDETRVAKLRAGEVDIITNAPYPEVDAIEKDGFDVLKFPANPSVSVVFDLLTPQSPWNKREVREAIAHAIDADAIIKGLFRGIVQRYPMLAPGEDGYDPEMKNYAYDPALAKKLLGRCRVSQRLSHAALFLGHIVLRLPPGRRRAVTLYLKQVGIECDLHNQEPVEGLQLARRAQTDHSIEIVTVGALPIANTGLTPVDMLTIAFQLESAVGGVAFRRGR